MAQGTDVEKVYKHHPPKDDQEERYLEIREAAKSFASLVIRRTPPSREQSLALTKIEEAMMWANAGIARNEE